MKNKNFFEIFSKNIFKYFLESIRIFAPLANIWGKEFLVTCLLKKEKASLCLFSPLGYWIQRSSLAAGAIGPGSHSKLV